MSGKSPEWRPIAETDGLYEVSETGRVRRRKTGHYREMKLKKNKITGYLYVCMGLNGSSITRSVHRLVALAFLPNPGNFQYVNHKDEDKTNNNVENLEWCSPSYNSEYSKHFRQKRVAAYSVDGEKLAVFESATIAAEFLGVVKGAVSSALKGRNNTCSGMVLKYEEGGE